jgi:hypothetical protein
MWAGQVALTSCMSPVGDFDGNGYFTLADAVFVARVWSGQVSFMWST